MEEEGLGKVQFSRELSAPTGRRLVVEWVPVSKDGARVAGKGGSSRWARPAAAKAALSTNGFPISVLLRPADFYRFPIALLGQCSWTDLGVRMEASIVFGAEREMTEMYIATVRQAILKGLEDA